MEIWLDLVNFLALAAVDALLKDFGNDLLDEHGDSHSGGGGCFDCQQLVVAIG